MGQECLGQSSQLLETLLTNKLCMFLGLKKKIEITKYSNIVTVAECDEARLQ